MMHYCNGTCPMYDAENGECCATDGPRVSVKPDAECFFDAYELDNPFVPPKPTNADRIRSMSDEELATEITKNPSIPCRMCEYYNHKLGHCDARRDFACVTAYAEALALDWLKQPVREEHNETD